MVAKRSLKHIEQSLRAKLAEAGSKDLDNDGVPDESQYLPGRNPYDPLNIGGKETGGPLNIDIGIGGASRGGAGSSKPRVTIDQARAARDARARAEQFLSGQGFKDSSPQPSTTKSRAEPPQQTAQERLAQQARLAQRGQDTAEPATIRDLIAAVPGLTKTNMAGAALGGGLIGAGVGLKGVEMLSRPSAAEQERADWATNFDARLEKSKKEQEQMRQRIERDQKIANKLTAKRKQKAMKENKNTRTLKQIEESLRNKLQEQFHGYDVPMIDIDLGSDLDVVKQMQNYKAGKERGGWNYDPGSRSFGGGGGRIGGGRGSSAAPGGGSRPKVWRGPEGQTVVPKAVQRPRTSPEEARAARDARLAAEREQAALRDRAGIPATKEGPRVDIKPDVGQRGPKFDPNKKYDTGLELKSGPGTREVWHNKPRKESPPLKPEEKAIRDRRSQQRYTPDLKDPRERRAGYVSAGGHAAALAWLLWSQRQKEKEAGGAQSSDGSGTVSVELIPSKSAAEPSDTAKPDAEPTTVKPDAAEPATVKPATTKPDAAPVMTTDRPSSWETEKGAQDQARKDAEEQARRAAEEKERARAAEEQARRAAEERARKDAEEKERARRAAEEQARKDAEEKERARRAAEKQAPPQSRNDGGTKSSVGGTSDQPGEKPGPRKGPGTNKGSTFDPTDEILMKEMRLAEKYNAFLQEDNKKKLDPKQTIEAYLGKKLTNSEYSAFLRTVGAESGREPLERAHIASVILNRAKAAKGDIIGVLNTPSAFQAITGPGGNRGTVFKPYYPTATQIIPGIDQEIASMLKLVPPGLMHFAAANPAAYREVGGEKKYREVMKQYSKDPDRQRVFASVFGTNKLGPPVYAPNANTMVQAERKLGDKFRDPYADLAPVYQPGYFTVGDSHGQGIAMYGKSKDGPEWVNKSKVGASIVDPKQFKTHMANIESIPAGSVVVISGGANDIGRPDHQAIVDNLNKMIAAARKRGLQVVYALPTQSPDSAKNKKREALRQTITSGLSKDVPVVDLGMASEKDKQQVHLDPSGYKNAAKKVVDMLTPGTTAIAGELPITGRPVGTQVLPDWSKYKYGDLGPLVKNERGEWTTLDGSRSATDPKLIADLEKLDNYTPPETFLDKVKRSLPPFLGGKGELVSQVFGDKKKSSAVAGPIEAPAEAPKPATKVDQPSTQTSSLTLEKEKRERELARQKKQPMLPPSSDPDVDPKGWAEYDEYMEKLQIEKGDKYSQDRERKAQEQKRQSLGLDPGEEIINVPLKKEPSKEIAPAKIKVTSQSPEKSSAIPVAAPTKVEKPVEKSAKSTTDQDVVKILTKDQTGLKQAKRELSDFEREFAARRAKGDKEFTWYNKQGQPYQVSTRLKGEKTSPVDKAQSAALAYQPQTIPQNIFKTPSSRIEPEPPSAAEIKKAMQDFKQQQAALDAGEEILDQQSDTIEPMDPRINAPGQNIDWKTIAPELFTTDKDNESSSIAGLKETINTQSDKDLLDILRLAGRK